MAGLLKRQPMEFAAMNKLEEAFAKIPWASWGRRTPISDLAKSIVPVGNHDHVGKGPDLDLTISIHDDGFEDWIMDIVGTAFQVGRGKLLTCWHVCEGLEVARGKAYLQASTVIRGEPAKAYYPISAKFSFMDPRHNNANPGIDVGILICPADNTKERPYNVPIVRWGDSTKVGVGDRVLIGGFPLGKGMFLSTNSNRGIVQPSFYDGVISSIIPAVNNRETRLFQISAVAIGGISGGVVCDASNGRVLGMVTSGLTQAGEVDLPITYAIPSEVLRPWCEAISFDTDKGERWR